MYYYKQGNVVFETKRKLKLKYTQQITKQEYDRIKGIKQEIEYYENLIKNLTGKNKEIYTQYYLAQIQDLLNLL
jgi:hypothetical protein